MRCARSATCGCSSRASSAGWASRSSRPRRIGGDYLGMDVNIAARLAEKAGAGEILVSEVTRAGLDPARVATRPKRGFRWGGVKGVPEEIAVHVATPR